MNRFFTLALAILFISVTYGQNCGAIKIKAHYDERIELMSIICHLAGFQEYNMNIGGDYIADIDTYFEDVRNHPAVEMMDSLRKVNGISFDSPMFFAVNFRNIQYLFPFCSRINSGSPPVYLRSSFGWDWWRKAGVREGQLRCCLICPQYPFYDGACCCLEE